ncbi:MAG: prolyl oligopeptidase family serine peptidase [Candidatus Paceibacterota bacterium]
MPNKKEDIIEDINGVEVKDPYRWLEDSENPEVKEWIKEQNKKVKNNLEGKYFNKFSEELTENFKVTNFSNPVPVNGRYFYMERKPDEDQGVLYIKNGLNGKPIELFNPNGHKKGNTVTIDYWQQSVTGKFIVYGVSEDGDEMATLFIKNVETNKELEYNIPNCRYSIVRWLSDDSGFFYIRNPRSGEVPKDEEHLYSKVYLHKLGDNPDNDELIFGKDRPKDDMLNIKLSLDDRYLAVSVSQTWTENDLFIYDNKNKELKTIVSGVDSNFHISFIEDKVLIYTSYKADNYRIIHSSYEDMYKPIDEWKDFIPEKDNLLRSFRTTKDKILIEYLVNACSEVEIFDYQGEKMGNIPLPKYSSLAGISARKTEKEFFYGVTSFLFPKITYRFNPKSSEYLEYRKTENPINPDDYEVKQEWCESKDGTKIPFFIFHKNDIELNSLNPTILYGYGGFGHDETPGFMRNWVPWIKKGGVFVLSNIRGGGEFGDEWHKAGIKEKKQNSFDDFIAVSEDIISRKYTSKNNLGILGGSNGGLLVSAVAVQRPDLFKAVCSKVPLTDMVRFHKFGIAIRWVHEYGNPDKKDDLKNILKWSPYHNVKEGVSYPSFLFTTADKDTRVHPFHARKMAAILQDLSKNSNVLLFTDINAGHGPGRPINKIVESQTLKLSFFAKEIGLKL